MAAPTSHQLEDRGDRIQHGHPKTCAVGLVCLFVGSRKTRKLCTDWLLGPAAPWVKETTIPLRRRKILLTDCCQEEEPTSPDTSVHVYVM